MVSDRRKRGHPKSIQARSARPELTLGQGERSEHQFCGSWTKGQPKAPRQTRKGWRPPSHASFRHDFFQCLGLKLLGEQSGDACRSSATSTCWEGREDGMYLPDERLFLDRLVLLLASFGPPAVLLVELLGQAVFLNSTASPCARQSSSPGSAASSITAVSCRAAGPVDRWWAIRPLEAGIDVVAPGWSGASSACFGANPDGCARSVCEISWELSLSRRRLGQFATCVELMKQLAL